MEIFIDFVQWLQVDVVLMILGYLDSPSDLIRLTAVSRFWRHFVISNKISKKLCLRLSPQNTFVVDSYCTTIYNVNVGGWTLNEWKALEWEYRGYALLARALLTASTTIECIEEAICASSTNPFLAKIEYTLYSQDSRCFYWSSKGSENPEEPETLTYKLLAGLYVITEIKMKPFKAYYEFKSNFPVYSAKDVRFRMGYLRSLSETDFYLGDLPLQLPGDDKFVWTYTSPVFPMNQESRWQEFKLPEPVLSVGGFLQIELLGSVQKERYDNLYYIAISRVKALGELLFPAFDNKILEPSDNYPSFQHPRLPVSRHRIVEDYDSSHPELDDFGTDGNEDDSDPRSDEDEGYSAPKSDEDEGYDDP